VAWLKRGCGRQLGDGHGGTSPLTRTSLWHAKARRVWICLGTTVTLCQCTLYTIQNIMLYNRATLNWPVVWAVAVLLAPIGSQSLVVWNCIYPHNCILCVDACTKRSNPPRIHIF
jgi:hypothetical protein